jgi:hypothetical protein
LSIQEEKAGQFTTTTTHNNDSELSESAALGQATESIRYRRWSDGFSAEFEQIDQRYWQLFASNTGGVKQGRVSRLSEGMRCIGSHQAGGANGVSSGRR